MNSKLSSQSEIKEREFVHNYNAATDAIYLAEYISHNFDDSLVPDVRIDPKALNTNWFSGSWLDTVSLFSEQRREFDTKDFGLPYNLNPMPAWFLQQQDHVTETTRFNKSRFIYTGLLLCRSSELVQFKQSMADKHVNNGQAGNIRYRVLNDITIKEPFVVKELLKDFAYNHSISIPTL